MSSRPEHDQERLDARFLYALHALSPNERAAFEAHLSTCPECQRELEALGLVIDSFESWPTDVLRPSVSLWERLSRRICDESGIEPVRLPSRPQEKTHWHQVVEGLFCRILSTDTQRNRVNMLVRLAPGTEYPAHRHGDLEELYLLEGELSIDAKTLHAGDYIQAEAGSVDHRVWSETGCTCLLLTSLDDTLL